MRRHANTIALAVALGLCGSGASAQTLNTELASLLVNNPRLKSSEKSLLGAGEAVKKSYSGYLPTALLSGDTGYQWIDSPTRRGSPTFGSYSRGEQSSTVTVTQNLFDGWKTTANIDSAVATRDSTAAQHESTVQSLLLEGINAYHDLLRQTRLNQLAMDNVETVQRQLELEDERVQRGGGVAVDVLLAKTRLQRAKERLVTFRNSLNDAKARYMQVFGREPDTDSLADPTPPMQHVPGTLEEVIKVAMDTNPSLQSSAKQIVAADAKRRVSEADFLPKVDLVGKFNYEKNLDATIGVNREASIVLKSTWEIFSGFGTRSAVAEATLQHAAAKDTALYTVRKVSEETRLAWNELQSTRERVSLLDNAVAIASEMFRSRRELRDTGKATALEVLDAENEVYSARIDYTNASYDARRAVYKILNSMGRLTPDNLGINAGDFPARRIR
jgi:adhesin transport system outer membrane protein